MRFHVIGLPHTNTTKEYVSCAYTQKVLNFCIMMQNLGHEVFLYGGYENDAPCSEFISCVDHRIPPEDFLNYSFNSSLKHWQEFNLRVIIALSRRIQERDFICVIAGHCQKPVADAFPGHMTVEFGVGYSGVFSKYRVFESYAWMHTVYGEIYGAHQADGQFFDAVIPNYYDERDFTYNARTPGDYFLYVGRIIDRKGVRIAADVCQHLGKRLILAGPGEPLTEYGEYIGMVGVKERGELMRDAQAVFCPSLYLEPFCGVHVEAMFCGTPVITTDFGAFTEYNLPMTGFRCRTFKEFVYAAENVGQLYRPAIRNYAIENFSLKAVQGRYETYFNRLATLWDKGWYQL